MAIIKMISVLKVQSFHLGKFLLELSALLMNTSISSLYSINVNVLFFLVIFLLWILCDNENGVFSCFSFFFFLKTKNDSKGSEV